MIAVRVLHGVRRSAVGARADTRKESREVAATFCEVCGKRRGCGLREAIDASSLAPHFHSAFVAQWSLRLRIQTEPLSILTVSCIPTDKNIRSAGK